MWLQVTRQEGAYMKNSIIVSFLFVFCFLGSVFASDADETLYQSLQFKSPSSEKDLEYLGLTGDSGTFVISDIKADILIVEVYSMDCPRCQRQSKNMKELFSLLEKEGYGGRIKLVGIGIGNSEFSTEVFKKKYKIDFPLIADPDSISYRMTGRVGIPYIILLKRDSAGNLTKVYSVEHENNNAEEMLGRILQSTGIK